MLQICVCYAPVAWQYNTCYVQHAHVIYIHAAEPSPHYDVINWEKTCKRTGKLDSKKYNILHCDHAARCRKQYNAPAIHKSNTKHLNIPKAQTTTAARLASEWHDTYEHTTDYCYHKTHQAENRLSKKLWSPYPCWKYAMFTLQICKKRPFTVKKPKRGLVQVLSLRQDKPISSSQHLAQMKQIK